MIKTKSVKSSCRFWQRFFIVTMAFLLFSPSILQCGAVFADGANPGVDAAGPHFSIVSVKQNEQELTTGWSDDICVAESGGSCEYGSYYYNGLRSHADTVIGVWLDGLEEGTTYRLNYNTVVTAADNKTTKYITATPYVSRGGQAYADEAIISINLTSEDYHYSQSQKLVFRAQEQGTDKIKITSLKQNDQELVLDHNRYLAPSYGDPITITYELENLTIGWFYQTRASLGNSGGNSDGDFVADATTKTITKTMNLEQLRQDSMLNVSCYGRPIDETMVTDSEYYSGTVRITDPEFEEFGKIIIDSIEQDGNILAPTYDSGGNAYVFDLNDVHDYKINFHVDQAMSDESYDIMPGLSSQTYSGYNSRSWHTWTGAELKSGVSVTMTPKYGSTAEFSLNMNVRKPGNNGYSSAGLYYNGAFSTIRLVFHEDTNLTRFDYDIVYTNFEAIEVDKDYVDPKYHNEDNSLSIKIAGDHFDNDQLYDVVIKVDQADYPYNATVQKTGAELNSGTVVELDDYTMQLFALNQVLAYEQSGTYDLEYVFTVKINEQTQKKGRYYAYEKNVQSIAIHENGQANSVGLGGGAGGPYVTMLATGIYSGALSGGNAITMYYVMGDLDDDETYTYELFYGPHSNYTDLMSEKVSIASGQMAGDELNAGQLHFALKNEDELMAPEYVLVLKNNNKVVGIVADALLLWDGAGIMSAAVKTSGDTHLQMSQLQYYIPYNNTVSVDLTGVNFDTDKQYTVSSRVSGGKYVDNGGSLSYQSVDLSDLDAEQQYSGASLNAGFARVILDYDERFKDLESVNIEVLVKDAGANNSSDYPGHFMRLKYIDIDQLLATTGGYKVDNATSSIKKIGKNTSVDDFTDNVVAEDGDIKVYDESGTTEQSGNMGTGMKVRLVDEYERPVIDMNAIVTGDVTGDGEITATDLARERQHLAGIRELDGVYKMAGSVENVENITATDLARMRQDIAGIREMK